MDSKRITALRAIMKREGIDYYYIPTADFHESEYVGRLSGFSAIH